MIYNEGKWKINRVSPLYNFLNDAIKLKQYATKVRRAIVSRITTKAHTKYTVEFNNQPNLLYNVGDAPGLMVKFYLYVKRLHELILIQTIS